MLMKDLDCDFESGHDLTHNLFCLRTLTLCNEQVIHERPPLDSHHHSQLFLGTLSEILLVRGHSTGARDLRDHRHGGGRARQLVQRPENIDNDIGWMDGNKL